MAEGYDYVVENTFQTEEEKKKDELKKSGISNDTDTNNATDQGKMGNPPKDLLNYVLDILTLEKTHLIMFVTGNYKWLEKDDQLRFKRGLVDVAKCAPTIIITDSCVKDSKAEFIHKTFEDYSISGYKNYIPAIEASVKSQEFEKDKKKDELKESGISNDTDTNNQVENNEKKSINENRNLWLKFLKKLSEENCCSVYIEVIGNEIPEKINETVPIVYVGSEQNAVKGSQPFFDVKVEKEKKQIVISLKNSTKNSNNEEFESYNFSRSMSFDQIIIKSIFSKFESNLKGNYSTEAIIDLAILFNEMDLVKDKFSENEYKEKYFQQSFMWNNFNFIEFFLREGHFEAVRNTFKENDKTPTFCTFCTLCKFCIPLYHSELIPNFMFNEEINKETIRRKIKEYTGGIIRDMYREQVESKEKDICSCRGIKNDGEKQDENKENDNCCFRRFNYKKQNSTNINGSGSNSLDNFEQDLFLCALLTQKIEIAKLFWREGKDHIGSALIGSTICRYLSQRARKRREEEKKDEFKNYSVEFEEAAKAILSEAYKKDPVRAHLLLIRTLPDWENETCLEIAKKSQRINFLSETAVTTKIYLIWLGDIPSTFNTYMIIFNIPLGLLYLFVASGLLLRDFIMSLKIKKQDANPGGSESEEEYAGFEYLNKLRVEHEKTKKKLPFYKTFPYIYEAPVTKFMMNLVSYVTFLACFTYVLLIELNTISQSSTIYQRKVEYVIYVFYLSFIMEDVRQLTMNSNRNKNDCRSKWIKWQSSSWNIFGFAAYIVFGISFILRQTVNDIDFVYCRSMFAVTLSLFYMKFMPFYFTQKSIGPKVMMINHMLKDLGFFLAIYLIALFAYGTFALALLYPNRSPNDVLLKNIVYNPYWQLFGHVDLKYIEGTQENGAVATPNVLVIIANALFLLFVNILLTNILIAMFGVTFSKEEAKSNRVLAYLKFRIIEEFYYRSIMPPPLNIFEIIYLIIVQINKYSKERNKKANETDDNGKSKKEKIGFSASLSEEERKKCSDFERKCMKKCWKNNQLFLQSKFPETKEKNLPSNKTDILYSNVNFSLMRKLLDNIRKKRRVTKKK